MYSDPSLAANDSIVIMSKPPNNSDTSSSHFLCLSVTGTFSKVEVPTFAFQFPDIDFRLSITEEKRDPIVMNVYIYRYANVM